MGSPFPNPNAAGFNPASAVYANLTIDAIRERWYGIGATAATMEHYLPHVTAGSDIATDFTLWNGLQHWTEVVSNFYGDPDKPDTDAGDHRYGDFAAVLAKAGCAAGGWRKGTAAYQAASYTVAPSSSRAYFGDVFGPWLLEDLWRVLSVLTKACDYLTFDMDWAAAGANNSGNGEWEQNTDYMPPFGPPPTIPPWPSVITNALIAWTLTTEHAPATRYTHLCQGGFHTLPGHTRYGQTRSVTSCPRVTNLWSGRPYTAAKASFIARYTKDFYPTHIWGDNYLAHRNDWHAHGSGISSGANSTYAGGGNGTLVFPAVGSVSAPNDWPDPTWFGNYDWHTLGFYTDPTPSLQIVRWDFSRDSCPW
ncbi:MAG: hypothetical protein WC485_03610 [Opitutaceae bacterium]